MVRILPTAEVGFLGLVRDEETLVATTYATRLPDDLSGRQCYLLDPMLATGGTLSAAVHYLTDRGADDITAICLLAAPEGAGAARAGDRLAQRAVHRGHRGAGRAAQRARATSCPASATPATACTAWSEPGAPPPASGPARLR